MNSALTPGDRHTLSLVECSKIITGLHTYVQVSKSYEEFSYSVTTHDGIKVAEGTVTLINGESPQFPGCDATAEQVEAMLTPRQLVDLIDPVTGKHKHRPEPGPSAGLQGEVDLPSIKMEAECESIMGPKIRRVQMLTGMYRLKQALKPGGTAQLISTSAKSWQCEAKIWPATVHGTQFTYQQAWMAIDDLWKAVDEERETYYLGFTFSIHDYAPEGEEPHEYASGTVTSLTGDEGFAIYNDTAVDDTLIAAMEQDMASPEVAGLPVTMV